MASDLHVVALAGMPEVAAGADLAALIVEAAARARRAIEDGDVFVVAQKIVSKAEGAVVCLDDVEPSARAIEWGAANAKDPRVIEVVLRESARIVRMERGVLIAETRHGFVCANAGVDASNVERGFVTLLPRDPDASAVRLRDALATAFDRNVAVIVSDTFGRPWREGVVNVALGVAGLRPLADYRGCRDTYGRELTSTVLAIADEIASAAELVMRKTARLPVAIVSGAADWIGSGRGADLVRDAARDLFR